MSQWREMGSHLPTPTYALAAQAEPACTSAEEEMFAVSPPSEVMWMMGRCGPASGLRPALAAERDAPFMHLRKRGACFQTQWSVLQQQRGRCLSHSHHLRLHRPSVRQQGKRDRSRGWGPRSSPQPKLLGAMCQKEKSHSWLLNLQLRLQSWRLKGGKKDLLPFVNIASLQQQSLRDDKYPSSKQHWYPVTVFIPRSVFWTINEVLYIHSC